MSKSNIDKSQYKTFEQIMHFENGQVEFRYARDLQIAHDYSSWDKFKRVALKQYLLV